MSVLSAADPRAVLAFDCHVSYLAGLARRGGGEVVERDGALLWSGPHPLPFLVNGACRTEAGASPNSVVAAAVAFFAERGRGFELATLEGRDDDLLTAAVKSGLQAGGAEPLQALDGDPVGSRPPADIEVRQVTDTTGVADVIAVTSEAHLVYGFPDEMFPTTFAAPATVLTPEIDAVVAYDQGRAVATAQAVIFGQTVYVGWVAVAPSAARRGLGRLVSEAAVAAGRRRGGNRAVLAASPMGAPLYRKMGFVDVGSIRSATFPAA